MTTRDQARRTFRRFEGNRGQAVDEAERGPSLPERLVAAREAKGVDLYRAERDTKIRSRYLAALERGDYAELPGTVYTKGFLRNYALYLGLNADDVLEQWRKERGSSQSQQPVVVVPKPLTVPRQGITLSRSYFAVALLILVVGGVVVFLGARLIPFLQPPTITVEQPAGSIATVKSTDTAYTFLGTANPGATINVTVDGNVLEPFLADSAGHWTYQYKHLHLGTNIFEFTATNPEESTRSSATVQVRINVPLQGQEPSETPTITLLSPDDGATLQNGAIPIKGTTTSATTVTISATYLGAPAKPGASPAPSTSPPASAAPTATPKPSPTASPKPGTSPGTSVAPGASPSPGASNQPAPVTVKVASDGSFDASYQLPPGKWQLAVTAANSQGQEQTIYRTVSVQYKGIQAVIQVKGGNAWIKVWRDGVVDNGYSNKIYHDGDTISITASQSVWVRTGVAKLTYVTVNGVSYGPLGATTNPGSWRLDPNRPPAPSNDF